jgi:Tfp pilus assembly PilM family ATPase
MSFLASLRATSGPNVAVELASHRVSAASLEIRGGQPVIATYAIEPLPAGLLVPSLTAENIRNRAAVTAALARVFERIGGRPRRIGLVVPDLVAKVSLVRFEKIPARTQDLDQLVRWQVRKTAPFPIEDAQVSYIRGVHAPDGQEFIVSLARRSIVEEYERLCADAGAHAGIVDLSTFNVINAVLAGPGRPEADPSTLREPQGRPEQSRGTTGSGSSRAASRDDWLLVNVATDYASIAIVRGGHVIFFRSREADADGTLADLVHQTAMYYEDRLKGGGFARVILAGGGHQAADVDQVRRSLEERLITPVEMVDPRPAAALTDRVSAAPALLDTLAPLVGLLLRNREAAA